MSEAWSWVGSVNFNLDDRAMNAVDPFMQWSSESHEALQDFLRALRRKKGFGLFFVQCSPAMESQIIDAIRARSPQKSIATFELDRDSETLYGELLQRYQAEPFEIACVTGLERSLSKYEKDMKRLADWSPQEIYTYSWKDVPPLMSHLNRQRENFESHLPIALIFLVRSYVIDYFIQRAPDFFDWRSGLFKFVEDRDHQSDSLNESQDQNYQQYYALTSEERIPKILSIKTEIEDCNVSEMRSTLLHVQGLLWRIGDDLIQALDCYERAIQANPKNTQAWNSKGNLLNALERYEEAIADFSRAIELDSNNTYAYNLRGNVYQNLKRYEEAIADYSQVIELLPSVPYAYLTRGNVYQNLKRYEEAIADYDRVLELQPNHHGAQQWRTHILRELGRTQEVSESSN